MKKSLTSKDERMANLTFSSVHPHYVTKVEKKDRTKKELHEVIQWLTGYDDKKLKSIIKDDVTFEKILKVRS